MASALVPRSELRPIPVGPLVMDGASPLFILGPCVLESEEFAWMMAKELKAIATRLNLRFVFKASYDKANRTSIASYRGLGCEDGCKILAEIGKSLGLPVTTDVHSPEEATIAGKYIDILQIPAFLCRQTDLVVAAANTGRVVNVKKGQFLAPWDVGNIAQKIEASGNLNFFFTERGTSFGYNTLVADMRSLTWIRDAGYRIVFDATHSVQRPGGQGATSGGDGRLAPVLARAAMAVGCDGVFIETHTDPSKALSDGPNQIPLAELEAHLKTLLAIHSVVAGLPV
jgi:2-dehydro-3-deoxyphosphooctonate aldolase (KDO 8-P synthase)